MLLYILSSVARNRFLAICSSWFSEASRFDIKDIAANVNVGENTVKWIMADGLDDIARSQVKFRTIIAVDCLFTVDDYKAFLIRINKILAPSGNLICFTLLIRFNEVPNIKTEIERREAFSEEINFLKWKCAYTNPIACYEENLRNKLDKYGFKDVTFEAISRMTVELQPEHSFVFLKRMFEDLENNGILKITLTKIEAAQDETKISNSMEISVMEPRVLDKDGFRDRVSAVIYRQSNNTIEFLFLKRRTHGWTFPGGGVEPNENKNDSVSRECFEECGISGKVIHSFGISESENRKTRTEMFLFEDMAEAQIYPENNRQKKWVCIEELEKIMENEELVSEFLGDSNETSRLMLNLALQPECFS